MVEISFNLFTILYGTLIFGIGYLGIGLRYFIWNKDFSKFNLFDKIIQSFVLGTVSFIIIVRFGFLDISVIEQDSQLVQYILQHPSIFIFQIFMVFLIMVYWIILEAFSLKIAKTSQNNPSNEIPKDKKTQEPKVKTKVKNGKQ